MRIDWDYSIFHMPVVDRVDRVAGMGNNQIYIMYFQTGIHLAIDRYHVYTQSGRVGSGRVGSGQAMSGQVRSGRVGSGRVGSGRVGSGQVRSGQVRVFNVHIHSKLL